MFKGERVALRPPDMTDVDHLMRWYLDVEMNVLAGWVSLKSVPQTRARLEKSVQEPADNIFSMMIDVDGTPIGRIDLGLIDWRQRRGDIGIMIDRAYRSKGYGKDAVVTFLQYAFQVKNMHKVSAMSYAFNQASINLFESVGFTREGLLRSHEFTTGAYRDMVVFGMLEDEFASLYPKRKFAVPEGVPAEPRPGRKTLA